jgi:hypothetical protein
MGEEHVVVNNMLQTLLLVLLLLLVLVLNSGQGLAAGSCECGNEPSGSIKVRDFLE